MLPRSSGPPLAKPDPVPELNPGGSLSHFVDGHSHKNREDKEHHEHHDTHIEHPLLFSADFLLLAPRRRGQDYAILGTNPLWGPRGEIKSLEGGYSPGFRIGTGYRFSESGEGWFKYLNYHVRGDQILQAPTGGSIFPTLTHPSSVREATGVNAANNLNMNLFDLEAARRVAPSEDTHLRLFAGARFANLDQTFAATYTGANFGQDDVRRKVTFDGGGLRAGGEAEFKAFEHLGLYFRGSASLLTGRFRSSLSEIQNSSFPIVNVSERYNKVIPILDLGVGLTFETGPLRLSLGYEFINWFGMLEGFDFTDDAQPAKTTRRTGDIGFDGLMLRAEWAF